MLRPITIDDTYPVAATSAEQVRRTLDSLEGVPPDVLDDLKLILTEGFFEMVHAAEPEATEVGLQVKADQGMEIRLVADCRAATPMFSEAKSVTRRKVLDQLTSAWDWEESPVMEIRAEVPWHT